MGIFQNIMGTLSNTFSLGKSDKVVLSTDINGLNVDKKILAPNVKIGTLSGILKASTGEVDDNATASDLPFTPSGDLESTNVQTALVELDSEKHIRNRAVAIAFTYSDFVAGSLLISNVEANYLVERVEIEVDSVFNGIPALTVGDSSDHASICPSSSSDLTSSYIYEEATKKVYGTATDVNIYFSGEPTQGSGTVTIFLSGTN